MGWYFAKDGQAVGPLELEALNENIRLGLLKAADLVWEPGADQWMPASSIASLWANQTVPPLLPTADDEPTSATIASNAILKSLALVCAFLLVFVIAAAALDLTPVAIQAHQGYPAAPSGKIDARLSLNLKPNP
jgi:hypothetical protein